MLLAGGIVALEFGAAVTSFVASTLLPVVAGDLHARNRLGLLIAGSTLGLFVALPLAGRILHRLGSRGSLAVGMAAYSGGLVMAATAPAAWMFALGQFCGGLASGLLGVFGVSSAIQHLDEACAHGSSPRRRPCGSSARPCWRSTSPPVARSSWHSSRGPWRESASGSNIMIITSW
jgi:MFS family permease